MVLCGGHDLQAACTGGACVVSLRARMALQVDMKKVNPGHDDQLKTCWATMLKYIGNIAKVGSSLPRKHCYAGLHLRLHAPQLQPSCKLPPLIALQLPFTAHAAG